MENTPQEEKQDAAEPRRAGRNPQLWIIGLILLAVLFVMLSQQATNSSEISYDFFLKQVEAGNVVRVNISEATARGVFKDPPDSPAVYDSFGKEQRDKDEKGRPKKLNPQFRVNLPTGQDSGAALQELLVSHGVQTHFDQPSNFVAILTLLMFLLPVGLLIFFWLSYRRTRDQIMGGGFLSGFTRSPARRYDGSMQGVTFDDVAGLTGVKADLLEIVSYLRNPQKFQRLGGRVPKGVLLNGPPGTGKTLLARAVAGEAKVPFYSVSGSEFIQMFVGVGASRVRDLFRTAKENCPAIIFVDEIDAVGRQRGAGVGGGHDEREQTLNQILSEMDGFSPNDSVIVIAATNRPDVLDPALLRPGRFDRHITVGRPTRKGRVEIFGVHVKNVPLSDDVNLETLGANTVGLTGADIRNIVNEAALWAARHDKSMVEMSDFEYARDKILMGAKREEILQDEEKEKTAYHEAGHTLAAWYLDGADRVHKVTIIPRGRALGSTQTMPSEDRLSISKHELMDRLVVLLGGRAAEELVYDELTVGAENDLERATGLARRMVTHWGMSDRLGPVSYKMSDEDPFLGREIHQQRQFSEHTMQVIDEEVAKVLHERFESARKLLVQKRPELDSLAKALLAREELDEREITEIIGPSVHAQRTSAPADASPNGQPSAGQAESPGASPTEQSAATGAPAADSEPGHSASEE